MKRTIGWLIAGTVAATLVVAVGSAAVAAPAGSGTKGATLRSATVSLAAMPAAARQRLFASGNRPDATAQSVTITIFELVNGQNGKCLDAATQNIYSNGDKVQTWSCFNDSVTHANQWWWPVETTNGYTELENFQSGLCLDADNSGGFVDGAKVQLWSCFRDSSNHPNQWWNFGPDGQYTTLPNLWGSGSKVLDAATQQINQNGGYVQIYQHLVLQPGVVVYDVESFEVVAGAGLSLSASAPS